MGERIQYGGAMYDDIPDLAEGYRAQAETMLARATEDAGATWRPATSEELRLFMEHKK